VLDENDNAPVVLEPVERLVSVRERQPSGTTLMQIIATDPDTGDNAHLHYSFSTGALPSYI
jgi:Cadherin domain